MIPPTIDTSVVRPMYSATSRSYGVSCHEPSPQEPRVRTLSEASTSSSISLATPVPSSGNASSSSLDVPSAADSRVDSGAFSSASEQGHSYSDEDESPTETFVRALHNFVPQQQTATCLAFHAGETIRVLNRDPSGWWDGEIDGRRGWFPSNYVTVVNNEQAPPLPPKKVHARSVSDTSFTSRTSTISPIHRPQHDSGSGDLLFPGAASYTHPLMVPLLHSLQLLQNTTLARRISHYQPAVACIIQCIRALLQQTECLARGGPILRRFPVIAQERKRVLADLALLVTQSKKASSPDFQTDEERDPEEEVMLRLAGQVFARVRRFLAVLVQCGIDLPERSFAKAADSSTSETVYCDPTAVDHKDSDIIHVPPGSHPDDDSFYAEQTHKDVNGVVKHISRSSVDSTSTSRSKLSSHRGRTFARNSVRNVYHGRHVSLSSNSSFSSFSSLDSPGTPPTPPFPEGPCTATQVQQALRSTHDSLLSTIAAFIGHVHAHSRAAHASSTGQLFALVRQIVDVVCRLLTIVDAVMCVEAIPWMKRAVLETAKENLYQVACALADAVREMATTIAVPLSEEEEERRHLLKVATDVLKAGSDCVSAVKTCLARPLNAPPYIIVLPPLVDGSAPSTPAVQSSEPLSREIRPVHDRYLDQDDNWNEEDEVRRASVASGGTVLPQTLDELHEQVQLGYTATVLDYDLDKEDHTVQPLKRNSAEMWPTELAYAVEDDEYQAAVPERDRQDFISGLSKGLTEPIQEELEDEDDEDSGSAEKDLPSPTSQTYTDAPLDGDASQGGSHKPTSLEDKVLHGELPSIPQSDDEGEGNIPLAWTLSHDYAPQDVAYNSEGQLVGATLGALVEKITAHDQIPDVGFLAIFFLTFRLFTTPVDLAEAVISRFNIMQPSGLSDADATLWFQQKLLPVRLRVQNLLKLWLEVHWRVGVDDEALAVLRSFVRGTMAEVFPVPAQRLDDLITTRSSMSATEPSPISERQRLNERLRDAVLPLNPSIVSSSPSSEIPRPIMTKALLATLRSRSFDTIAVTDFDALELARQMTLVESQLYCAITAEELIELGRSDAPPAVNVKAVSAFSTAITGWVSELILGEQDVKKRALLMKFFIKVADRCTSLNNFSTPRSILAALDSATISRLHQTWSILAQKSKVQLEALRKLADHARNYHEYRTRLRNTSPPAVPFLGLYLTDLTFCREGNPSHRASPLEPNKKLLNFNKYQKLARIVQDMQRFQIAYNLKDVVEAQEYLHFCLEKVKDHGDLDDLYRRSQLLEPRRPAEAPAANELKSSIFGWGNRSQSSSSQATVA